MLADEASPSRSRACSSPSQRSVESRTRVEERFRTGDGLGWHEHDDGLFHGVERVFGAAYRTELVTRPGSRRSTAS